MTKRVISSVCVLLIVAGLAATASANPAGTGPDRDASASKGKKCKHGFVRRNGKCRRKKPAPVIVSGTWGDGRYSHLEVKTASRTVTFQFDGYPCISTGIFFASSGPTPVQGTLPGKGPGTKLALSGSYTRPGANNTSVTETTTWELEGKFTTPRSFVGRLHIVEVIPPSGPFTGESRCESDQPITLSI